MLARRRLLSTGLGRPTVCPAARTDGTGWRETTPALSAPMDGAALAWGSITSTVYLAGPAVGAAARDATTWQLVWVPRWMDDTGPSAVSPSEHTSH